MSVPVRLALALSLAALGGCANMSGLGGETSYSCPLPKSGNCKPMSQVYDESVARERGAPVPAETAPAPGTEGTKAEASKADAAKADAAPVAYFPTQNAAPFTIPGLPAPLLTRPRVLRVYIAPWADSNDTLLEGRRAYLKLDDGRWRLDHFRANERKAYAPIRPPSAVSAAPAPAPAPVASAGAGARPFPPNPFLPAGVSDPVSDSQGGAQ